jgi:hypothetical protein
MIRATMTKKINDTATSTIFWVSDIDLTGGSTDSDLRGVL